MAGQPRKTTPNPMPDQEILNIDGAAAFLGVSVKTFSKVLREGDVPGRKVGREWKFSRQALVDWIGRSSSRTFLDGSDAEVEDDGSPQQATGGRPASRRSGGEQAGGGEAGGRDGRKRKVNDGFSVDEL